jgi:ABC-type nitrate/sulfonate/bicarbonate transport system substrate-binding protein
LRAFGITPREPDIMTNGGSPMMVTAIEKHEAHHRVAIASTDCVTRAHIIGRKGITTLAGLKGKRIGVATRESTSGFHALLLARRMGWDPERDIIIVEHAEDIARLLDGSLDAIIGYETDYAIATRDGLPILADTRDWQDVVAGNSTLVDPDWLRDPTHRDAVRRFLRATIQAIALMKRDQSLAFKVMSTWYGVNDPETARTLYARGKWIPRKPYPCDAGFARTLQLYDSDEMRKHMAREFYDDSLVREIDASGYIDALYRSAS